MEDSLRETERRSPARWLLDASSAHPGALWRLWEVTPSVDPADEDAGLRTVEDWLRQLPTVFSFGAIIAEDAAAPALHVAAAGREFYLHVAALPARPRFVNVYVEGRDASGLRRWPSESYPTPAPAWQPENVEELRALLVRVYGAGIGFELDARFVVEAEPYPARPTRKEADQWLPLD